MSNQGTIRLKVTNGAPAIEKLWNGRFKLEFFCDNNSPREDWYYENVSALLPEYGILQATNFGSGVSEDWEAIPDSVYPDMRLVLAEYPYNVRAGKHYVKLTYETLTAAWVEEKDEDTDYELNGLKRVSRTFVALPGTVYDKVIGTSTIDSGGTTLYLGSFKIEKTEAKWELTEVWLEAGTLSETLDNVGSQKAKVIETIGADPATPNGYSLASKQESDFEGFQTNRFTFLKDNVELSRSKDKVGSQLAITTEVFKPAADPTETGYSVARTEVSDVDGIPTKRFTLLKDEAVLSRNIQTKNGGKLILEVVEVFNGTPVADTAGSVQIGNEVSDVDGIPTKRFTFAKGDGQISVDRRPAPAQLAGGTYVTVRSLGTPVTPTGVIVAESESESDGYITYEKTALQGTIVGIKQTYKDVVDVTVAGTVNCTSVSKSVGGISGTIAVAQVTPPRTKTLAATVTVEVTTSPPNTISLAYDLGDISCSVTSITMSENYRGTDVFTTSSGNSRFTGNRKAADMSARVSTYPNCYLSSSSGTGTFSYTSSYENASTNPTTILPVAQVSATSSFTNGTGSTSATYSTTGVVERTSRPILTTLDGTIYFEVVTWTV